MKLMSLEEYRKTHYTDDSRPDRRTLIKQINEGLLPGKKQGRFYFIDIEAEARRTGNPLVDRILADRGR